MNSKKYSKILTIILILIIVAVIGLLGYLGYSYYNKNSVINGGSDYVDTFDQLIATENPIEETTESNTNTTPSDKVDEVEGGSAAGGTSSGTSGNKVTTYKGFEVLDKITIMYINRKVKNMPNSQEKILTDKYQVILNESFTGRMHGLHCGYQYMVEIS